MDSNHMSVRTMGPVQMGSMLTAVTVLPGSPGPVVKQVILHLINITYYSLSNVIMPCCNV